jgi:arylsulfatase A-like enzyme
MNAQHILLITMDQLSREALSCYGATALTTANLDRLAATGTQFDNAYTASHLCLPSRCAILTGQYPHRSGAYSNFRQCALKPELPNLYNRLRAAGYTTGHIGKCHYSPAPYHLTRPAATIDREPVRDFYLSLGLDHLDLQNGKHNSIWFWNDYSRELEAAGHLAAYREACWDKKLGKVFVFPGPAEWHPDAWVGRKGVEYLDRLAPDRPSFTWVSFSGPHYPLDPPAEYLARVDAGKVGLGVWQENEFDDPGKIQYEGFHGGKTGGTEGRWFDGSGACKTFTAEYRQRYRHHYFANVVLIDDWIGRLLDGAEARFGDNLLVLFTSDHGDMLGNHRLTAKNRCAYEDVLRVPLLVRGPGFPAQRSPARVSLLDIMPTCLRAAGVEMPPVDGRDLRVSDRRHIITEAEGFMTIQDERYKYIQSREAEGVRCELYDLEEDPHEFVNLVRQPEHLPVLAALRARLVEHFMDTVLA